VRPRATCCIYDTVMLEQHVLRIWSLSIKLKYHFSKKKLNKFNPNLENHGSQTKSHLFRNSTIENHRSHTKSQLFRECYWQWIPGSTN
jgi:hypothetical protein